MFLKNVDRMVLIKYILIISCIGLSNDGVKTTQMALWICVSRLTFKNCHFEFFSENHFSNKAHCGIGGYVNKQNWRISFTLNYISYLQMIFLMAWIE